MKLNLSKQRVFNIYLLLLLLIIINYRTEYKNKIKRSNDHYKRAVYSYLCRMNDDDLRVLDNVDDFLWFKLNIVVCSPTNASNTSDSKQIRYLIDFYLLIITLQKTFSFLFNLLTIHFIILPKKF